MRFALRILHVPSALRDSSCGLTPSATMIALLDTSKTLKRGSVTSALLTVIPAINQEPASPATPPLILEYSALSLPDAYQ